MARDEALTAEEKRRWDHITGVMNKLESLTSKTYPDGGYGDNDMTQAEKDRQAELDEEMRKAIANLLGAGAAGGFSATPVNTGFERGTVEALEQFRKNQMGSIEEQILDVGKKQLEKMDREIDELTRLNDSLGTV
jgi:hypothetical protein